VLRKHENACEKINCDQMRFSTSEPLVPPKPKLFLSAASIFMGRAVLAQ
jgi:hypothetical protein